MIQSRQKSLLSSFANPKAGLYSLFKQERGYSQFYLFVDHLFPGCCLAGVVGLAMPRSRFVKLHQIKTKVENSA